nr:hypothetical protein [Clostridia bacterium]
MRRTDNTEAHKIKSIKPSKIGIKWKVFGWFALFTAIILTILWLCQIVFLDDIYKMIKMSEIRITAAELTRNINSPDFKTEAEETAKNNDICLIVLKMES